MSLISVAYSYSNVAFTPFVYWCLTAEIVKKNISVILLACARLASCP